MNRCGIYLRLSREDGFGESESIQNQRSLLRQYIEKNKDFVYIGEWVDDGWSGSRFDRPGFCALLQAVYTGRIDCILVKDLSRFGREYIQTGYYLNVLFPKLGVRFIAVSEQYDSDKGEFMENSLLLPVLNLLNDAYCRDISMKVRLQKKNKREAGEYIGAFAVYGYQKKMGQSGKLCIDEEAAQVVRTIFWLQLSGMSAEKITQCLEREQIASPAAYKRKKGSRYRSGFVERQSCPGWKPYAVRRILQNKMYTGLLIQGKEEKVSYKLPLRRKKPQEEWDCIAGKVEAIVSPYVYRRVQSIFKQRIRCLNQHIYCSVFAGILEKRRTLERGSSAKKLPQKSIPKGKKILIEESLFFDQLWKKLCIREPFFLKKRKPQTVWMKRIFLVLFLEKIYVEEY